MGYQIRGEGQRHRFEVHSSTLGIVAFLKDNAVLEVDTQHDVVTFVFAPNILAVTIVSNTVHEKTTLLKIQPVPQISTI